LSTHECNKSTLYTAHPQFDCLEYCHDSESVGVSVV